MFIQSYNIHCVFISYLYKHMCCTGCGLSLLSWGDAVCFLWPQSRPGDLVVKG